VSEGAVGFFVEGGGDGFDCAGEDGVVLDVEFFKGEAGFEVESVMSAGRGTCIDERLTWRKEAQV